MLQKPGHGSPIARVPQSLEGLVEALDRAVARAEQLSPRIVEFSREARHLVTTYTGLGAVAGWVFSGFHQVLAQTPHSDPLPAYHASLHVAPYREEDYSVVHWMGSPWERGETARLADALYIMNVPALYIIPDPDDPLMREKLPEGTAMEAGGLLEQVMLAALAGLRLAVEKTGRGDMRVRRLEQELLTPQGVVEGLWASYGARLEELVSMARESGSIALLYTRMMTPAALVMGSVLSDMGVRVVLWEASSAPPSLGGGAIVIYTSTEGDVWREVFFRRMRTGQPRAQGLELRTDPLSAQVYGVLLALMTRLADGGD